MNTPAQGSGDEGPGPFSCLSLAPYHLYHTTKGTGTFWNENVAQRFWGKSPGWCDSTF